MSASVSCAGGRLVNILFTGGAGDIGSHAAVVLEMARAFEAASGRAVHGNMVKHRLGDVVACYASVDKTRRSLGWQARRSLQEMCASAWRWQQNFEKLTA